MMEKRDRLKEITQETAESQMQGWQPSLPHLARVNEAARKHRELKFTNLLHHVDVAALERAFRRQRVKASAGIDGVTVNAYRQDLKHRQGRWGLHKVQASAPCYPMSFCTTSLTCGSDNGSGGRAGGQMMATRYADDVVLGFQYEGEARKTLADLKERFGCFGLALHEDKTRRIRFGRFAVSDSWKDGLRRPQTFNFLGFTHSCATLRNGTFTVKRQTITKRLIGKLKMLRMEMKRRIHIPVREQQVWLSQVLRGHYGYFGVVSNHRSLETFHKGVKMIWYRALRRRRQKAKMTWARFLGVLTMFPLPKPVIGQQWSHSTG